MPVKCIKECDVCSSVYLFCFCVRQEDLPEEPRDGIQPPISDSSTPIEKDIVVAKDCFQEYLMKNSASHLL